MYLSTKCINSSLISHLILKQSKQSFKNASYLPIVPRKSVILSKSKYELIYDFPLIKFPAAFSRTRFSVPIASIAVTPFLLLFSTKLSAVFCLVSAGIHYAVSTASSKLSQNIVGKIYINKEGRPKEVIISSVDKFGNRIDRSHNIDEFVNCDYYSKLSRYCGFIRLAVENSDIYYKINIRNCKIYNPEACSNLLGRLWILPSKKQVKYKW